MNRWAANNPELYEQLGHEGYVDYFREAADMERKRQKEEGLVETIVECPECGHAIKVLPPKRKEGLYACATCGEPVRHYGQRCERCKRSMEEDRLERESGR